MSVTGDIEQGMNIDFETLLGACCGLAGTFSLALNFVIIRKIKLCRLNSRLVWAR